MLLHAEDALALQALVPELAQAFTARGWRLATAESCTGGLMAALCTSVAGSSDWFERGVVSYSNAAKTELLGVPEPLIDRHGAVSEPVARAMATGLLQRSSAQVALAVTGVAGPGGGSPDKPVGTVWVAWAWRGQAQGEPVAVGAQCLHLTGDRTAVRGATAQWGLRCGLGLSSSSST